MKKYKNNNYLFVLCDNAYDRKKIHMLANIFGLYHESCIFDGMPERHSFKCKTCKKLFYYNELLWIEDYSTFSGQIYDIVGKCPSGCDGYYMQSNGRKCNYNKQFFYTITNPNCVIVSDEPFLKSNNNDSKNIDFKEFLNKLNEKNKIVDSYQKNDIDFDFYIKNNGKKY